MSGDSSPTPKPEPSPGDLPEDVRFDQFDLSDELLEGVEAAGYERPTEVQVATIPPILEGHEVVVQARTGTGKTAAFGLPLLELLDGERKEVQAVVLTPTRELARQVSGEIALLGSKGDVRAAAIYGGDPMPKQVKELRSGAQIVVGTPGRVLDHLRRGTLKVGSAEYFVLDEADEMLSMGFAKELNAILGFMPRERRTLLFSATFPREIERLVERMTEEPVRIKLSEDNVLAEQVEHHYYVCSRTEKLDYLVAVLDDERIDSAIVFCNRRDETRLVANSLQRHGYHALPINSDLNQTERNQVMGAIKSKDLRVLVATDIAARGIDISKLSHVINYTVPESPDAYVHRTGRTGRVGRKGTAVTLVSGLELSALKQVESIKGIELEERRLPPEDQIMTRRVERLLEDLKELASLKSPEERIKGDREEFREVAKRLQEDEDAQEVVYLLLQSFFEGIKRSTAKASSGTGVTAFAREVAGEGDDGGDDEAEDSGSGARSRSRSGGSDRPRRKRSSSSGRRTRK